MRYDSLAQYDNPNRNVLPRFCNATDGSGEKTYILNKIVAGLIAYRGHRCLDIFNVSRDKDFGWDWQVLYPEIRIKHIAFFKYVFLYKQGSYQLHKNHIILATRQIKIRTTMWSNYYHLKRLVLKW